MSGDCDKCGEHCLDCKCNEIRISPSIPLKISINKEYFRKKFTELIDKDYLVLTNFCRKQLVEDLLACFDKKDD